MHAKLRFRLNTNVTMRWTHRNIKLCAGSLADVAERHGTDIFGAEQIIIEVSTRKIKGATPIWLELDKDFVSVDWGYHENDCRRGLLRSAELWIIKNIGLKSKRQRRVYVRITVEK